MSKPEMRHGPNQQNALGIDWPTANFDSETLTTLVRDSRFRPLREIIARHIEKEGNGLLSINLNDEQRIAVVEYVFAARSVLSASSHVEDRGALIEQQLLGLSYLAPSLASDPKKATVVRSDLNKVAQNDIQSITIDPKGFDLLDGLLKDEIAMDDFLSPKNEDAAHITGFSMAVLRYKDLYNRAVLQGATPDKKSGFVKRLTERVKRARPRF